MTSLEELLTVSPSPVLFECIAGSRAYGTMTTASDEDIRGVFAASIADYLALERPPDQLSDARGNVVYYSLRRTIELLALANPNILELLFMPGDCIVRSSPEMEALVVRRDLFVSKRCADTHVGYAMSQIKKARGQNKWINNPKPEAPPEREDYCYIIPWIGCATASPPARPIPLRQSGWLLTEYHAAKLEHAPDCYRLYHYGPGAHGVFRGEAIVCESIPLEDEHPRFAGFLLYNDTAWRQDRLDHHNYWTWRRERNEARWEQQETGATDFDAKNMMHTVRLLLSGKSLMENGRPIVRFDGESLDLLMSVRAGKLRFEEIMELAQSILADCERLKHLSHLPEACDLSAASKLLRNLTDAWEQRRR
jgi:uncharacterized protein